MKKRIQYIILTQIIPLLRGVRGVFFILLVTSLQTIAQTFPVQVIPQITPPPPVYLSDYASTNNSADRVRAQILLTDLTVLNRQVRLKLYIEGNGINTQSRDFIIGAQPIFLDGGIPVQLGSIDLAPYFELQNLQGISAGAYANAIPEGLYQFCFEVYDVLSGNRISNKSCTNVLIFLNDPPFLNLPENNINLEAYNPQNILFQWTPRHINVSNVEYEFSLVEIWDTNIDPQAIFLSSPPIYQITTQTTSLLYGLAEPQLLEGKRYAWRVKAQALDGIDEIGLFKNNGYSEIFSFTYQGECNAPSYLTVEEVGTKTATFKWQGEIDHTQYKIDYRKAVDDDGNTGEQNTNHWFESTTNREEFIVIDLESNTMYEWRVGGYCADGTLSFAESTTFTTMDEEVEAYYNCGIEPSINIANQLLLDELQVGDVIKAGDFNVKIQEVSGNSSFSGKGYTTVGFLKNLKIALEFTNIQVNTEYQFVNGEIKTVYDPTWSNILDVDELIGTVDTIVDEIRDLIDLIDQLDDIYNHIEDNRSNLTEQEWTDINNNVETIFETAEEEIQTLIDNGVLTPEEGNSFLTDLEEGSNNYETGGSECEGQGTDCNESLEASQQTFEAVINNIEAKKDIAFFEDAQKLLSSTDAETTFWETIEKLEKVYDFFSQCHDEKWASYQNKGIIPYCFWRDSEVASDDYYDITDIPFLSGLVDGLYQEGEGIVQIPETVDKMSEGIRQLTYAYTIAYLKCPENRVIANKKRFENLLDKLEVEDNKKGFWSWIKEKYYESEKKEIETYIKNCDEVFKLRKEIEDLYEMVNSWDEIKQLYQSVKTKIVDYWNTIQEEENIGRYKSGKLTIFVASAVVPLVGQLSKASKVKNILKGLKNFTESQWDDLFRRYSDELANRVGTGIKVIDDFLALAPKIDNISPSSLPSGYQIVTINNSKYVRRIDISNTNTPRLMVDETGTIVQYIKPTRLSTNNLLRNRLKQANGGVIPNGHQAHHIVPDNVIQNSLLHQEAINRGLYDIDRTSNGKLLAETAEDYVSLSDAYPTHFGSHPNYDTEIVNTIDDVLELNNILPSQVDNLSDAKLLEIIDDIEDQAIGTLEDWVPSKLN